MQIKIPNDVASAPIFSNVIMARENGPDFVLDFAVLLPEMEKAIGRARVIVSPAMLKLMREALQTSVSNYEAKHGEIKTDEGGVRGTGNGAMIFQVGLN